MDTERIEELVSAALDGEAVDLDALRHALATADGRDALAAFVLLRAATASDLVAPVAAPSVIAFDEFARRRAPRRPASRYAVAAALAASLTGLALAGSFWLGSRWQTPQMTVQLAPPAIVRPATVPLVAPAAEPLVLVPPCLAPVPPQPPLPTRVVRYVSGVDWRDGTNTP